MTIAAIAATFSCEPIGRWLSFWLNTLGLAPSSYVLASYGQLEAELRRPRALCMALCGATVCVDLLRFADWQRGDNRFDTERFESDLTLFEDTVRAALLQVHRLLLLVCPARPSPQAATFAAGTARLQALASGEPRLTVVDVQEIAGWYAVAEPHDLVADELGHLPYSEPWMLPPCSIAETSSGLRSASIVRRSTCT